LIELSPIDLEITVKLILAVFLGAIIGLERELHKSAAGIKTFSIVCLGATLFTSVAAIVDIRVTTGVITGVGFLGAATVFKSDNRVIGLTTAALIWSTSAVGFALGTGYYLTAIIGTILIITILYPIEKIESKILKTHHHEKEQQNSR
jgi:putative Mg2+ transporter-C (MgtC) family protein